MTGGLVDRLRSLRVAAGLSQEELARRAQVSVRAVRDIEHGRVRHPRRDSVERLAAVLGLSDATPPQPSFEVHLLGPFSVSVNAARLQIESARQRVLLAVLALQANRAVPRGELIEALWGDAPPDSYAGLIHTYVARLRKVLAPAADGPHPGPIVRTAAGYLLRCGPDQTDAARFAGFVARAGTAQARGEAEAALRDITKALALWRGPVLADLDARLQHHPAVVALRQQRIAAALTLADLGAGLGHPRKRSRNCAPSPWTRRSTKGCTPGSSSPSPPPASRGRRYGSSPTCGPGSPSSSASNPAPSCARPIFGCCARRYRSAAPGPRPARIRHPRPRGRPMARPSRRSCRPTSSRSPAAPPRWPSSTPIPGRVTRPRRRWWP
ncbi:hypothetical protein Psuf_060350 [Phytohabitans suffuscus]|uniref:HTH cro/C1-type domain-containing protein n=1 Tax=Phytohabitans suffuscus TaxID=624315 RepID=A0A6F8YRJ3_9ACTN|nr:helix-turn-helix domain-containing protein [Phytohabitans suffuscus]BCB88722.1 hypothetical protein Psuf_060350 [Phytohabitans suffuscus]